MKGVVKLAVIALFEVVAMYTFYLYSLRSDVVPWGSSVRDGLYFLAYFFYCLPLMMLLSILKIALWKKNNLLRFNYLTYTILVFIPSFESANSQVMLNGGMILSLVVAVINLWELLLYARYWDKDKNSQAANISDRADAGQQGGKGLL